MPPQEVDGGITGNSREPVRRFPQVLELLVALERLDEGFLGEVLRVGDVSDDPVDQ